jgi:hypothetical protein
MPRKATKRKNVAELAVLNGGHGNPLLLNGARTVRTLSARFMADMQAHWEINGMKALDIVLATAPARYVDNYVTLARIIRVEADVKHTFNQPKTVDEALAELESKVGTKGRRKFEKFLREVAEDENEDVIDVESR